MTHPARGGPCRHKVALVQQQYQMLVRGVFTEVILRESRGVHLRRWVQCCNRVSSTYTGVQLTSM